MLSFLISCGTRRCFLNSDDLHSWLTVAIPLKIGMVMDISSCPRSETLITYAPTSVFLASTFSVSSASENGTRIHIFSMDFVISIVNSAVGFD